MRVKTLSPLPPHVFSPPKGRKQIYLPNITLTLLRTPHAPAHFASFLAPLHLNKLDLRDFLYRAYGLEVRAVRSFVVQARVRQDKPGRIELGRNKWFRPRATKKMTIELAPSQPFVWPDPPVDFSPWSQDAFQKRTAEQEAEQKRLGPQRARLEREDGPVLAEQARALREGRGR